MNRLPWIAAGWVCVLALGAAGLPAPSLAQTAPINPTVTNCNITPPNTAITSALLGQPLPCNSTQIPRSRPSRPPTRSSPA